MSDMIKVKIQDAVEATYDNVDTVILPTTDGGTAVFRKVNYADALTSKSRCHCHNGFFGSDFTFVEPETSVVVTLA